MEMTFPCIPELSAAPDASDENMNNVCVNVYPVRESHAVNNSQRLQFTGETPAYTRKAKRSSGSPRLFHQRILLETSFRLTIGDAFYLLPFPILTPAEKLAPSNERRTLELWLLFPISP